MCLPAVPPNTDAIFDDERRFLIKLRDKTGIDIGIITAEFIVVAESPAEAEMYVRQLVCGDEISLDYMQAFDMITREIPTTVS